MLDFLIMILGLTLILAGANYLVDGSSAIARKFGISDFIIGMTIIGIGTSAPEMAISFISSLKGNADIAVGNVIGSNIFNTLVILGVTALITPIALTSNNIRKDIPFSLLAAVVLFTIGSSTLLDGTSNVINRVHGVLLLLFFAVFMAYSIFSAKSNNTTQDSGEQINSNRKMWINIIMVIGGLVALIIGGDLFIKSASSLAKVIGISDKVIALTLMAGGTSLPELASCIMAAYKKNTAMALGNVIGSNISNIFLILGGSALINPISMANIGSIDLYTLVVSSILIFITTFSFKRGQIDRAEGGILILLYIAFILSQFI